ncbi:MULTISPECIES: hypothetical protein [unclassified Haematobacter]|uniref:hypothetical protein n=1 Tax=unclassified Haematobacter TaxID=2640585 RepID=UPI0025BA6834|nr:MULTISPECIES: hypothetical protein [unclassified Haematobacter]
MFAPKSIKKYKTPEEYVLAMGAAQTEWQIIDNLMRVGRSAWNGEYFENPYSYGTISLSFTEDTMFQLDAILEHAGHNVFDDEPSSNGSETSDAEIGFHNALGNVMRDRVLECILSRRRVNLAIWQNATGVIVEDRARDVFYMTYAFDESTKFGVRLSCSVMFVLGAALLAIPTIITSLEVISQIAK